MIGAFSACALAGLVALGGWERVQRDRARRAIPIRIHVNGTRGKSTVTRMIAAALRASGRTVVAKTTGTAARLILPDGGERDIRRRACPSIREQLWFLREAHRRGADAIVVECMAIDPALQLVSEHDMIAATIGVITNARHDHADVMGDTPLDVATALANTVPRDGVLVLGDVECPDVFSAVAARHRSRVVRPDVPALEPNTPAWFAENVSLALAVTRALDIPDEVALPAILAAPADPGAMRRYRGEIAARPFDVIDASAANDPDSLLTLLADVERERRFFVFNHRDDRPTRLAQFATSPLFAGADSRLLVTGDRPDWMTQRRLARRVAFVPASRLAQAVRAQVHESAATVVLCGNAKGLDVPALVASLTRT